MKEYLVRKVVYEKVLLSDEAEAGLVSLVGVLELMKRAGQPPMTINGLKARLYRDGHSVVIDPHPPHGGRHMRFLRHDDAKALVAERGGK